MTTAVRVPLRDEVAKHEGMTPQYPFVVWRGEAPWTCKAVMVNTAVIHPTSNDRATEVVNLDRLRVDPEMVWWIEPKKKGIIGFNGAKHLHTHEEQRASVRADTDAAALKDQAAKLARDAAAQDWARNPDPKHRKRWNAERSQLEASGRRRCFNCRKVKVLEDFSGGAEGRTGECQECQTKYEREHYASKHPGYVSRADRKAARESQAAQKEQSMEPYDPRTASVRSAEWSGEQLSLKSQGKRRCPRCRNVSPLEHFNSTGFCRCRLKRVAASGDSSIGRASVSGAEGERGSTPRPPGPSPVMRRIVPAESIVAPASLDGVVIREPFEDLKRHGELIAAVATLRKEKADLEKAIRRMVADLEKALA